MNKRKSRTEALSGGQQKKCDLAYFNDAGVWPSQAVVMFEPFLSLVDYSKNPVHARHVHGEEDYVFVEQVNLSSPPLDGLVAATIKLIHEKARETVYFQSFGRWF